MYTAIVKHKLLREIIFVIKTIMYTLAFLQRQSVMSSKLGWRATEGKILRMGNKKNGVWGVGIPYGGAKRPVIRPDISHAGNNTSQTRNDIEISLSLSLPLLLPLTRLRVPATSNASSGQYYDQLYLDNS